MPCFGCFRIFSAEKNREPGESPGRPRHCERGAGFHMPLVHPGRRKPAVSRKSGDLPETLHVIPSAREGECTMRMLLCGG